MACLLIKLVSSEFKLALSQICRSFGLLVTATNTARLAYPDTAINSSLDTKKGKEYRMAPPTVAWTHPPDSCRGA